jgi:hypothetical protein
MGILSRISIKIVLIVGFAIALSGCGIAEKSPFQQNEAGINEAYLGCLMYGPDILKCADLRWSAQQAIYNNIKPRGGVTIEDINKATPIKTDQEK